MEYLLRAVVAFAVLLGIYQAFVSLKIDNTKDKLPELPQSSLEVDDADAPDEPIRIVPTRIVKGLGGGLFLVLLAMLASLGLLIYLAYLDYSLLSEEALARGFIASGTEYKKNPYALWFDIRQAANLLLIIGSTYTLYLFFEKSSAFPRWFAWLFLAMLVAIAIDSMVLLYITQSSSWIDIIYVDRDPLILFCSVFLVPYVLYSQRAQATFIKR